MTEPADTPDECPSCEFSYLEALPTAGIYVERWTCPACGARGYELKDGLMPNTDTETDT